MSLLVAVVGVALWLHRGGGLLVNCLSLLCNVRSVMTAKRTDRSRVQAHYFGKVEVAALFFSHSLGRRTRYTVWMLVAA